MFSYILGADGVELTFDEQDSARLIPKERRADRSESLESTQGIP